MIIVPKYFWDKDLGYTKVFRTMITLVYLLIDIAENGPVIDVPFKNGGFPITMEHHRKSIGKP